MLILLSPAKNLRQPAADVATTPPRLMGDVAALLPTLRQLSAGRIAALMGLSDKLAVLNHARYQALTAEAIDGTAAILTFNGDVYRGFDAASLDSAGLARAQDRVRILSGLYGLLRPLDAMQPYRLEMGTRLKTKRGATLYEFWGERIAALLRADLQSHRHPVIINCASNEYARAVPVAALGVPMVTCHFKQEKDGLLRALGLYAKLARGQMARFAVDTAAEAPEQLQGFDRDGYRFRPDLSSEHDWVFTRPQPKGAAA